MSEIIGNGFKSPFSKETSFIEYVDQLFSRYGEPTIDAKEVWTEMKRLYQEQEDKLVLLEEEANEEEDYLQEQHREYNDMISRSLKRN